MSDQIADIIDDAADVIEKYGWTQGSFGSEHAGFCVEGAFMKIRAVKDAKGYAMGYYENKKYFEAEGVFAKYLHETFFSSNPHRLIIRYIPQWNDEEGRTQQEVLDTLRLVAKQQRTQAE